MDQRVPTINKPPHDAAKRSRHPCWIRHRFRNIQRLPRSVNPTPVNDADPSESIYLDNSARATTRYRDERKTTNHRSSLAFFLLAACTSGHSSCFVLLQPHPSARPPLPNPIQIPASATSPFALFSGSPPGTRLPAPPSFTMLLSSTDSRNRLEHSTLLAHRHFFPVSLPRTVFLLFVIILLCLLPLSFRPLSTVVLSTSTCFETTTTAAVSRKYHRFSKVRYRATLLRLRRDSARNFREIFMFRVTQGVPQ